MKDYCYDIHIHDIYPKMVLIFKATHIYFHHDFTFKVKRVIYKLIREHKDIRLDIRYQDTNFCPLQSIKYSK